MQLEQLSTPQAPLAPQWPGIAPSILWSQVLNTAPWVTSPEFLDGAAPYLALWARRSSEESWSNPVDYYRLNITAHHTTVATFVPTDVDNAIRFKLWSPTLDGDLLAQMAELVLESRQWHPRAVTTRWVEPSRALGMLSGHDGEWFSTAAAAFSATRRKLPEISKRVGEAIMAEFDRHEAIFKECLKLRDGIQTLKAATLIAHNLGDLDRVLEQWKIPEDDALMQAVFQGGDRRLKAAGELNKKWMAAENHRHFALRKPRGLRRSSDLLLPVGPFFDDWGRRVARHPALTPRDVAEIVEALVEGWENLKTPTQGYARAIAGILDAFPGGASALGKLLPARVERKIAAGPLRAMIAVPQQRFEARWRAV